MTTDRAGSPVQVASPDRRPFFTVRTLAQYLAISERTVKEMVRTGVVPSYLFGGARRIDAGDVDACLTCWTPVGVGP